MLNYDYKELVDYENQQTIAKRFLVNDLPDCFAKEKLVRITDKNCLNKASVFFVAKPGRFDDFAVYYGLPQIHHINVDYWKETFDGHVNSLTTPLQIIEYGTKLTDVDLAREMFPEFSNLNYRL